MNYRDEMDRIFSKQETMALATAVDHQPNVRVVNFVNLPEQPGVLYFASFPDNVKVREMEQNSQVAFTTLPPQGEYCHVKAKAQVKRSGKTIFDLKEAFVTKIDGYDEVINMAGEMLVLFEAHFSEATVTLDIEHSDKVKL